MDRDQIIAAVAGRLQEAARWFVNDGTSARAQIAIERGRCVVRRLGVIVLFTRDEGHHACGWWKNPDYERCCHLSLSFFDPATGANLPRNKLQTARWIDAFFGRHRRFLWCEPPYSREGRIADVWHYRLFCDPAWGPIKPRGEVYTREFTEAGWKSWSDVQADLEAERLSLKR